MNSEILLEAFGEMDLRLVRAARPPKKRRKNRRPLWLALPAAALAVLAAVLILFLPERADRGFTTEAVEDFSSIADSWDGTLLAENLLAAGAELSDIRLEHREGMAITDASGWKSLSFTAERGEDSVEMTCTFGIPEGFRLPDEPTETVEYGGVTVWLYIAHSESGEGGTLWSCRTVFAAGGVAYDMDFSLAGPEDRDAVYRNLDMILGAEADGGGFRPLENLMGFADYRVTSETGGWDSVWHFWVTAGGVETCVAEVRGPEKEIGIYGVDLDGDGRDEAVTNNVSADGVEVVTVYRYDGESFWVGRIDGRYLDEAGFADRSSERPVNTRFDPETGMFTAEYAHSDPDSGSSVTFSGPEHLLFRRFRANALDHFALCPLSWDGLEHTDARPLKAVLQSEDYRVGIERTAERDEWHFFAGAACLAEASARPGETPEVYSADVDADGTSEFISNEADGTVKICGFVGPGLRLNQLTLRQEVLDAACSRARAGGRVTTRFDPETGLFTVAAANPEGETVYTESFPFDLEKFDSAPYYPRLWGEPEYMTLTPSPSPAPAEDLPDVPERKKLAAFASEDLWQTGPEFTFGGRTFRAVVSPEARLYVRDETGEETDLGPIGEGDVRFTAFKDILDFDGAAVRYGQGDGTVTDLYRVDEKGVSLLARCAGDVYAGDINDDGIRELVCGGAGGTAWTRYFLRDGETRAETALDALREVLAGERKFLDTLPTGEVNGTLDMETIGEALTDGGREMFRADSFALADMDGDGTTEAAVRVVNRAGGYEMGSIVLRYCAGEVYGYKYDARCFEELKSDGTYMASRSASDRSWYSVTFDGTRLDGHMFLGVCRESNIGDTYENWLYYYASSAEDFGRKEATQNSKPNAEWLELTAENIAAAFGE